MWGKNVTAEAAEAVGRHLVAQAHRWDLGAAAYLMRGGYSDDGFDYFRGWLIAQGRSRRERALADPDSLADAGVDPDDDMVDCEYVVVAAQPGDRVGVARHCRAVVGEHLLPQYPPAMARISGRRPRLAGVTSAAATASASRSVCRFVVGLPQ